MAGEVKGQIYEAITKVALELAMKGNRKGWKVLWHEQPDWISIEADLALGKDKESIEALFLVTHVTSEKMSEKKFWRNVAEIFQWKIQGKGPIRCYDIIFDAAVKPELKKISETIPDAFLVLPSNLYGKTIIDFVKVHQKEFGNSDEKRVDHTEALCTRGSAKFDSSFAKALSEFADDLKEMIPKENKQTATLWQVLRPVDSRKFIVPKARNTYVRNGIAKLIIFDNTARQYVYDSVLNGNEIDDDNVPQYARDLNLVYEDMLGFCIKDQDMVSAIKVLGKNGCETLVKLIPPRMQDFLDPLRSVGNLDVYSQFVIDHFDELKTVAGMKKWLKACYVDPAGILPNNAKIDIPPRDTWLFMYCMTLEKADQNKVVAYGLSNLANDTGVSDVELRFAMPNFLARKDFPSASTFTAIAKVFSEKLTSLGLKKISSIEFLRVMKTMLIQRQMYVLSVYRLFSPLSDLIKATLKAAAIKFETLNLPSCLKEFAGASAATSQYIKVGADTLIYWQSCHGSHVNDKTKELSARFRATKVMWDGKKFSLRPEAKRIFFVADGEWRVEDFKMFMRSGVDGIFYPDEMYNLVKAIKG